MDLQTIAQNNLHQITDWLPNLAAALIIFSVFYVGAQLVRKIILHSSRKIRLDSNVAVLLARSSRIGLIVLGVITALGTLGIDISAMVAGLGLTGFALGFALKDTISNLLSGVLILLYRPFIVGNNIRAAGHEGRVKTIDLRYTELESSGQRILIPNSRLFTDPIVVLEEQPAEQ